MIKRNTFLQTILPMTLPFALVQVMMAAVFSVYECPVPMPVVLLGSCVLAAFSFALCRFTEKHRRIGGLLITVILMGVYVELQYLVWGGYRVNHIFFQQWALTAGSETTDSTYFLWAMFLGGSVFFSVTIYYFARVLYRISFLTLISLLPCVLYAKVMTDIDNVYLILLAILNVGIFMVHRSEQNRDGERRGLVSIVISSGAFILLVFLVCAILPKENEAKYYDRFEDTFLGGDTSTVMAPDFTNLGEYSGNADRFSNVGNRRLYSLFGENITYLKRQNFDYYDFKKDRWYPEWGLVNAEIDPSEWTAKQESLQLEKLQEAMRRAEKLSPGFAAKYGLESIVNGATVNDSYYNLHITALNFSAVYYLIPTRGISVYTADEEPFYASRSGTFRREAGPHSSDYEYDISFYDEFSYRNFWFENGGSNLTYAEEGEMLSELLQILSDADDTYARIVEDWYQDYTEAIQYYRVCVNNNLEISDEIRELAEKITGNCEYAWEKATALQDYFHGNGFVYDLKYVSTDTTPEYFLFQSKRGTCSDYASAFVLMARSLGMIVRYAEGYVPEFASQDNTYYVKDSGSHAYPEVFIPGMGWTIFEPTTAAEDIYGGVDERESLWAKIQNLKMDLGLAGTILVFGAILIGIVMFVRMILPFVMEIVFRIRIRLTKPDRSVLMIYQRTVKKCARHGIPDADCMTPRELEEILKGRAIDIKMLREAIEDVAYGNRNLSAEQKKEAIVIYGKCSLYLLRKVKK